MLLAPVQLADPDWGHVHWRDGKHAHVEITAQSCTLMNISKLSRNAPSLITRACALAKLKFIFKRAVSSHIKWLERLLKLNMISKYKIICVSVIIPKHANEKTLRQVARIRTHWPACNI